jgi:hypothetical protein
VEMLLPRDAASAQPPVTQTNMLQPQRRGAPVALIGQQLVWWHGQWLELWNLGTGQQAARLPAPESEIALGVVGNAIVAVARDAVGQTARLVRFENFTATSFSAAAAYYFAGADRIVGATPSEFWLSEPPRGLARYRIADPVERLAAVAWSTGQGLTFTAAAEEGSALFYERGCIVRLSSSGARESFAVSSSDFANPLHLAAGPRAGTAWATSSDEIFLLDTSRPGEARQIARTRPGDALYHLTSAGANAIAITVAMQAGHLHRVQLLALGAINTILWRVTLPTPQTLNAWAVGTRDQVAVVIGNDLLVYSTHDGVRALP